MHLIVLLGNPGREYTNTRHNIGFLTGESLITQVHNAQQKEKFHSICISGHIKQHPVILIFPQTYMNLSGKAVTAAMTFHKIPPENILVLYDDLDIPFGTLRFREKGSAGTHNGMRSIVGDIGPNFPRLRIGIGPKPEGYDTSGFVLGRFSELEKEHLPKLCTTAAETVSKWLSEGKDAATRHAASVTIITPTTDSKSRQPQQ